jgi:methionyl-tRNA synthetase
MLNKVQYVTTAIVYPNSRIHVGWAWECLGADWLVRSHRLFGRETYFATGMDEHAIKVQRAAEAEGLTPKRTAIAWPPTSRRSCEGSA